MYEIEYLAREYGDKVLHAPNASAAEERMKKFVQHGLQRRLTMKDADVDCATAAYLLYIGLLVSSMLLIIFGFVTHFVAKGMKRKSPRTQLRIFGMLASLSILGMWMATTIAGSTPQVANLVMVFSFVGMALLV